MFRSRFVLSATLAAAIGTAIPVVTTAASAFAQSKGGYDGAFKRGYEEGVTDGGRDAEHGLRVDYSRHREYRNGQLGWDGHDSRNDYRNAFRKGYAQGYDEGYRTVSDKMRIAAYKGGPMPTTKAAAIGSKDGYQQGRDDARRRLPYDPKRALRWQSADHDYDSRFGRRDAYSFDYRLGFEKGYDDGYREARR